MQSDIMIDEFDSDSKSPSQVSVFTSLMHLYLLSKHVNKLRVGFFVLDSNKESNTICREGLIQNKVKTGNSALFCGKNH